MSVNYETAFFSKLIQTNDMDSVNDACITQKYFSGVYKRAFKWVCEFKTKYGKVPSQGEFSKKFPSIVLLEDVPETMRYYADQMREKMKHNLLASAIESAAEELGELNTDEAYKNIKKVIFKIDTEVVVGDMRKINEGTEKRLEDYYKRRDSGGITGIPFGIAPLDATTGGMQPTDLVTILGYVGTGKSWALTIIACHLAREGYKVLFVTREMGTDQLMKRVDAVAAGISYEGFNRGTLTPQEEEKLIKYYKKTEGDQDNNLIIELAVGGVTHISALVDKHEPEVLLIDGGYLLTDDEEDTDWNAIIQTWRGFKQIALTRKVPTIVTMQLKGRKASLEGIALAKYISQDCDVIYGLEQTEEMQIEHEIRWKPLKLRDAAMTRGFICNWDWNKMDYSVKYAENYKDEVILPKAQLKGVS